MSITNFLEQADAGAESRSRSLINSLHDAVGARACRLVNRLPREQLGLLTRELADPYCSGVGVPLVLSAGIDIPGQLVTGRRYVIGYRRFAGVENGVPRWTATRSFNGIEYEFTTGIFLAPAEPLLFTVNSIPINSNIHWYFDGEGILPAITSAINPTYRLESNGEAIIPRQRTRGLWLTVYIPLDEIPEEEIPDPVADLPDSEFRGQLILGDRNYSFEIDRSITNRFNFSGNVEGIEFNLDLNRFQLGEEINISPEIEIQDSPGGGDAPIDTPSPLPPAAPILPPGVTFSPRPISPEEEGTEEEGEGEQILSVWVTVVETPHKGKVIFHENPLDTDMFAGFFRWTARDEQGELFNFEEIPIRKSRQVFYRPDFATGFRFYAVNQATLSAIVLRVLPESDEG